MRDFQKLDFWLRSHQLTLRVYSTTKTFPREEFFGLVSQMRRSSSSVPTNIAEGCGRKSNAQLKQFLVVAVGSISELQYQLILCKDLGYIDDLVFKELENEVVQIRKMIFTYHDKL